MGSVYGIQRQYGGIIMNLNDDLQKKMNEFPGELAGLAKYLLSEIESGKRSVTQIEENLREEIRELVIEELEG